MSEIEKMYENAGVKPTVRDNAIGRGYYIEHQTIEEYPTFTTEKQIEILKLLTNRCDLMISHFTEWEFIHFDGQERTKVTGKDFTETFAKLINAYWQNFTSEEKQQVKGILE